RNRSLVERRSPVEYLDCGWNRDNKTENRKYQARVLRLTRHKHVMAPHQEANDRDGKTGECDEGITEDLFMVVRRDEFAHHTHSRQNHDVNSRMRIEPEHMLEKNRIATQGRIENSDPPNTLDSNKDQCDCQHRRAQHLNDGGGVMRPDKQRQPE